MKRPLALALGLAAVPLLAAACGRASPAASSTRRPYTASHYLRSSLSAAPTALIDFPPRQRKVKPPYTEASC